MIVFESVRQFFKQAQDAGYRIEIQSFDQIMGTMGTQRIGFTIRGMCFLENDPKEKQPLMIENHDD